MSEPLLQFLRVQRKREVLRHSLEAGQPAIAPFGMVADIRFAVGIELVSIGGKLRIHGEGIVLPPLQTQAHAEVAPAMIVGSGIVGHTRSQLINDAYLPEARGVLVTLDLHLDVVAHVPTDHLGLVLPGDAVQFILIR